MSLVAFLTILSTALIAVCIGLGSVISGISIYSYRQIQILKADQSKLHLQFEKYKLYSEENMSRYAKLLSEFSSDLGYREMAEKFAERLTIGSTVNINAGGDVNSGGDITGRNKDVSSPSN